MKQAFAKIKERLKSAKNAIVTAHVDPDGDAVGSMLAMGAVIEQFGLKVSYYCADLPPRIYRFLPGADKIRREVPAGTLFDLAIVLDSSDLSRIGEGIDLRQCARVIINLDHHPDNTQFGDINYVTKASSVAEEVYDLAVYLGAKIDKRIADCLYAAIITDTGNFRYENTNVKTFLIAGELLKAGVNTHEISTRIYDNRSLAAVRICALAMTNMQITADHKAAWMVVTKAMMDQTGAKGEDMIGMVDHLRSIEGVEVAILFREEKDGTVKVNFRSKDRLNVSEIARRFGGGGHVKASGATLEGKTDEVVRRVVAEVEKYLQAAKYLV
ncbi:MAG: bifunctional oligoribonuclease/PAP phosphatase NrnA [Candidatus Margulisbacteria bacterium]|jgi:phosphoesterase RecJ-like protein|nr:bifunctional oligoribonuclease/PAP phosphatase NrnA [Candidatus Margulisiibacteriota bacterium]